MARKTPARDARGRFRRKGARKTTTRRKSNPRRRSTVATKRARDARGRFTKGGGGGRRRSAPKRRRSSSRRRNPPLLRSLQDGLVAGVQVTAGEGVTRLIPHFVGLPRTGVVGVAVEIATAVVVGMVSDQFIGRRAAEYVTAGAMSVPIKGLALRYAAPQVPLVGSALTPALGVYSRPARRNRSLAAYSRRALPRGANSMAGYDYASAAAMS